MDRFKTKVRKDESIPISEDNFTKATGRRKPYYREIGKEKRVQCYAVCPLCDNPIQIIGLYQQQEFSKKPYGRHHGRTIDGLAVYDEEAYSDCPYSNPDMTNRPRLKRSETNATSIALYQYLMKNFDNIIGVLEHSIGIHISKEFAYNLLRLYTTDTGWRYYDSSYQNLPYMLMFARPADKLFGRFIYKDSPIAAALEKYCDDITLQPKGKYLKMENKDNRFVELTFFLTVHKFEMTGENMEESYILRVLYKGKEILNHKIIVDPEGVSRAVKENLYENRAIQSVVNDLFD